MSSSSPRNANSRSKSSSSAESRKRTQEVETGEAGEEQVGPAAEAPGGATAAQLESSALEAADQGVRDAASPPDRSTDEDREPAIAAPVEESADPTESSPLGREILGAARDLEGDWTPEATPAGSTPSTPLEM